MSCITCQRVDLSKDSPFLCIRCKESQDKLALAVQQTLLLTGPQTALVTMYREFRKPKLIKMPTDMVIFEIGAPQKDDNDKWHSSVTQATSEKCDDMFREMERRGIQQQECIEGTL